MHGIYRPRQAKIITKGVHGRYTIARPNARKLHNSNLEVNFVYSTANISWITYMVFYNYCHGNTTSSAVIARYMFRMQQLNKDIVIILYH